VVTADGSGSGLVADVRVSRGSFDLDVALVVRPGETVAVVGPNGAGKTTLMRTLAGLGRLDAGRVVLDGVTVDDPNSGVFVPAEHRPVGVVFQDYLLFAHLDVLDNVAFGLRARGELRRSAARKAAAGWVDRFGLTELAHRRPGQLSGGQAQRVALTRALATDPGLLLLDEPLSALDAATRLEVRAGLRDVLSELAVPVLVVTHDLVDALTLADRLVVIERGRVTQVGEPAEVTRRPRTDYVARLVGLELLAGTATSSNLPGGGRVLRLNGGGELPVPPDVPDGPVLVAVRPDALALFPSSSAVSVSSSDHVSSSGLSSLSSSGPVLLRHGPLVGVEPVGERLRVTVGPPPLVRADLSPGRFAELANVRGAEVAVVVDPARLTVYPR
jgi:molybdate transport system ATP-binding protein